MKLENILLDADGHIKITDFGLSIDLDQGIPETGAKLAGTLEYLSPECINQETYYGLMSDWWSVGIITHELFTGKSPFSSTNIEKETFFAKILNDPPEIDDKVQGAARDFVIKLLQKNVSERLGSKYGADEIKQHRFFEGIDWNLMSQMMYPSPVVHKYADKYDVSQFDEEFTNTDFENLQKSEIKTSKGYEGKLFTIR